MKNTLYLFLLFTLITTRAYSQNVIAVTNNTGSTFYSNLDSAIVHAQNGDYVYLPGGSFTVNNLSIDKNLNIIGAGCDVDSSLATGTTMIVGNMLIKTGADGGSLQGLYINGQIAFGTGAADQVVNNYSILRCNLGNLFLSYNGSAASSSTNIFLKENIFRGTIHGGYTHNVVISKCIIEQSILYFSGQVTVDHCIFLKNACCGNVVNSCSGVTFSNNVICEQAYALENTPGNTYLNNIFCHSTPIPGGSISSNNIFGVNRDSIWVNAPGTTYNISYNYQLRPSSAGNNAGTDGTDIGVYGTAEPFKEGSVPVNPHIRQATIPTTTDGQGNLNVNIKVGAQQQ